MSSRPHPSAIITGPDRDFSRPRRTSSDRSRDSVDRPAGPHDDNLRRVAPHGATRDPEGTTGQRACSPNEPTAPCFAPNEPGRAAPRTNRSCPRWGHPEPMKMGNLGNHPHRPQIHFQKNPPPRQDGPTTCAVRGPRDAPRTNSTPGASGPAPKGSSTPVASAGVVWPSQPRRRGERYG
jgi:hypothetical protein